MAKLYLLGSCSGTEPMPERKHTSFVLEAGNQLYWFDAGEGCSYTAHLLGIDLLKIRSVFISHPHMDHVGGLANLLWTIHKLTIVRKTNLESGTLNLFVPDVSIWEGILRLMRCQDGRLRGPFSVEVGKPKDGLVYEDENVRVTAMHNAHMPDPQEGEHISYSYCIETEGKKIVFSGDLREYTEIQPLIGDGCDYLLMETGHHKVQAVCDFADEQSVGQLIFVHHGREILNGAPQVQEALAGCSRSPVIGWDGMTIEL